MEKEEDETDLEEMYYAVRDSFERLSLDLGDKFFMSAIFNKKSFNKSKLDWSSCLLYCFSIWVKV